MKKIIFSVAIFICIVLLAVLIISLHAGDEFAFVYNEYDPTVSFEDSKHYLEEKGYSFEKVEHGSKPEESVYRVVNESKDASFYISVYNSVEKAKECYYKALGCDCLTEDYTLTYIRMGSVIRVDRYIYSAEHGTETTFDILASYQLNAPPTLPILHEEKVVYEEHVTYEELSLNASTSGYMSYPVKCYNANAPSWTFSYLYAPERNACLLSIKTDDRITSFTTEELYKIFAFLVPAYSVDEESVKIVLCADGMIIGDSYSINLLLQRIKS